MGVILWGKGSLSCEEKTCMMHVAGFDRGNMILKTVYSDERWITEITINYRIYIDWG